MFSEQKLKSFSISNVPFLEWHGQKSVISCTFGALNETRIHELQLSYRGYLAYSFEGNDFILASERENESQNEVSVRPL